MLQIRNCFVGLLANSIIFEIAYLGREGIDSTLLFYVANLWNTRLDFWELVTINWAGLYTHCIILHLNDTWSSSQHIFWFVTLLLVWQTVRPIRFKDFFDGHLKICIWPISEFLKQISVVTWFLFFNLVCFIGMPQRKNVCKEQRLIKRMWQVSWEYFTRMKSTAFLFLSHFPNWYLYSFVLKKKCLFMTVKQAC